MNKYNINITYSLNNWYLVVCLSLILSSTGIAQDLNRSTYDFEVKNKPLYEVLDKLSHLASINFTYNSNESAFGQRITYIARKKTAGVILDDIMKLSGQKYKKIGNQWVIFANEENKEAPPEVVELPKTQIALPPLDNQAQTSVQNVILPVSKPDTIILRDTLILKESLILRDTLVIRDTITVIKEIRHNRKPGFRNFPRDFFQFDPNRSDGLFLGLSYGQYFGGVQNTSNAGYEELLQLNKQSESLSFRNFSVSGELGYNYKKLAVSLGVGLKGFSNRFNYNQSITSGGYYRQDTVSWYYNIVEMDTTWFAVTDSSYLPFEKVEANYNQLNRVGFLDFQLGIAYTWFAYANVRLYVKGGLGYSMMIYHDGILIRNTKDFPGLKYSDVNLNKHYMTYQFGTGINYMAGNKFDIFAEVGYQGYTKSIIADYPIEKKLYSVGIRAGLIFFL